MQRDTSTERSILNLLKAERGLSNGAIYRALNVSRNSNDGRLVREALRALESDGQIMNVGGEARSWEITR